MNKIIYTAELVKLKYDVMLRRIDDLKNIFSLLSHVNFSTDELNSQTLEIPSLSLAKLQEIKEQYIKMFDKMMESQVYQKYSDIEKAIMPYLAQLDNKLSQYVYHTKAYAMKIINILLSIIKNSEDYETYQNMEDILSQISDIEELIKRYSPYLSTNVLDKIQNSTLELKFDCLMRAQVDLILKGERQKYKYAISI